MPVCFGFFGGTAGPVELLLLFAAILLLFGPRRLPRIARSLGKALEELRRASQDFRDQIMSIEEEAPPSGGASGPVDFEALERPESAPQTSGGGRDRDATGEGEEQTEGRGHGLAG